ncbi:MAG: hypothetical protein GOMPHAMPRED_007048 [Gomphillus americanus]|uniref:Uncharacterized protein n=1 Tax=Gomphillus americanus TaxID=1940652 RepID=A0A8H3IE62_9LECA|nr:MAG: hypothetical protein GOMPHAMPRED_007048 [Gomphillus americanus]
MCAALTEDLLADSADNEEDRTDRADARDSEDTTEIIELKAVVATVDGCDAPLDGAIVVCGEEMEAPCDVLTYEDEIAWVGADAEDVPRVKDEDD